MRKSYQHFTRAGRKTILDEKVKAPAPPTDAKSAQNMQNWQVWTQGPSELKHTKRKFKNTTPGQSRDYKDFVKGRRFKAFEEVEAQREDAPTNSVAGGGVDMNPTGKERKLDGRTKDFRDVARRIKSRIEKKTQKETAEKLKAFGVGKPFGEETEMSTKYLTTKKGSIEASVYEALNTRVENPNEKKPTLTLSWRNEETEIDEAKRMSPQEVKDKLKKDRGIGVEKNPDNRRQKAAAARDVRRDTGKTAQALDQKTVDRKADFKSRLRKSVDTGAPLYGKNEETEIHNDLMASVVNEISKHAAKTKETDTERKYRENQEYDTARHKAKTRTEDLEVDEAWKKDTMKEPSPGVKSGFRDKDKEKKARADKRTWPKDYRAKTEEVEFDQLLDSLTDSELDELEEGLLGAVGRGIKKVAKFGASGVKKAANRMSTSGRADAAEKKLAAVKKKKIDRSRLQTAKAGIADVRREEVEIDEATPDNYDPDTHTQAGSKQKKKPNYNTKTHRLISKNGKVSVISKGDWVIKGKEMRKGGWILAEKKESEINTEKELEKQTTKDDDGDIKASEKIIDVEAQKKDIEDKKKKNKETAFTDNEISDGSP